MYAIRSYYEYGEIFCSQKRQGCSDPDKMSCFRSVNSPNPLRYKECNKHPDVDSLKFRLLSVLMVVHPSFPYPISYNFV